jgi:hypothetical protein
VYVNAVIWQQCKNAWYALQNNVLSHGTQKGSGTTWRDGCKMALAGLCRHNVTTSNVVLVNGG